MNWNANKSVRLSQVCVVIFAALLLALDIGCYWAVTWFVRLRRMQPPMVLWMMLTIYLCSIFCVAPAGAALAAAAEHSGGARV